MIYSSLYTLSNTTITRSCDGLKRGQSILYWDKMSLREDLPPFLQRFHPKKKKNNHMKRLGSALYMRAHHLLKASYQMDVISNYSDQQPIGSHKFSVGVSKSGTYGQQGLSTS